MLTLLLCARALSACLANSTFVSRAATTKGCGPLVSKWSIDDIAPSMKSMRSMWRGHGHFKMGLREYILQGRVNESSARPRTIQSLTIYITWALWDINREIRKCWFSERWIRKCWFSERWIMEQDGVYHGDRYHQCYHFMAIMHRTW